MGGSSGGGGDSTTKTEPWEKQKPYLQALFRRADKLYDKKGPSLYPEQMTAGFAPAEQQAQQATINFANSFAPQFAQGAAGANNFLLTSALYPSSNPALQETIDAATRPITRQFTEQIRPQIASDAFSSGLVGSSRQGIAEGLAAGRTAEAVGATAADIANRGYQSGLTAMGQGLALAPQTMQLGLAGPQALAAVGQQQRSYEQALLDEAIQRYQYKQNLPYQKLAQYQNLIQGGYGGTTIAQAQGGQVDPLFAGLGGAATGAAAGAPFGPWGMGIGAAAGGLLGLFG